MSCDAAMSAAYLVLAAFSPSGQPTRIVQPIPAVAKAENPLAKEKLFADIIKRAAALNHDVDAYRKGLAGNAELPAFDKFSKKVADLSELDMQGHLELAKRGTDGDLKCILRGISQDLPRKLDDLMKAQDAKSKDLALREMGYLLRDNVEVITAPPAPEV
jgi:hypothetical protein